MGAVAEGVLERGGSAIGVIPHFFVTKEVAHDGLDELIVVGSMHERKARMAELSDGFIALPGGWGTIDMGSRLRSPRSLRRTTLTVTATMAMTVTSPTRRPCRSCSESWVRW